MTDMTRMLTVILSLLISGLALPAEDGVLDLRILDVKGQPVRGIGVSCGERCATAFSDDAGRTRLKLPPEMRSDAWVSLLLLKGTGGQEWVLISPWDFRLNVPSFANRPENISVLTVARKGDRELLGSGRTVETLTARIVKQLKARLAREITDEERQRVLREQADAFGLTPADVDAAIHAWGQTAEDPYQQGLSALYERNYPRAIELLTQSYDLRKAEKEKKENAFVDAAVFLGDGLYAQGKFREAAAKYREASAERPTDGVILNSLAKALLGAEDLDEAERAGRQAVSAKLGERGFGPRSPQLAGAQFELARVYYQQKKFAEAEATLLEALETNEQELGPADASVETCLRALADVYFATNRYPEGQKALQRANDIKNQVTRARQEQTLAEARKTLADQERELGPDQIGLEPAVRKVAFAFFYLNRFEEAEPFFRRALALREKALGLDASAVAISVMDLARVCHAQKKFADAETAWKRALTILEKVVEPDHYRLLKPLKGYLDALTALGREADAKVVADRIRRIELKYPEYGNARKSAS